MSQTKDIFSEVQEIALFATSGLNRNDLKVYLHFNIFAFDSQENFEIREEHRRWMFYLLCIIYLL